MKVGSKNRFELSAHDMTTFWFEELHYEKTGKHETLLNVPRSKKTKVKHKNYVRETEKQTF